MDVPEDENPALQEEDAQALPKPVGTATYTKHMDVKAAWFAKPLFQNGEIQFKSWRGRLIRIALVCSLVLMLLVVIGGFFSFANINQPMTPRLLLGMIMTVGIPAYFWHEFWRPWIKLIEDRFIVASETYVAFDEKPAQFELMKEGGTRWIQLVRYTAPCPVCGATLHLANGKQDFPGRVVGRCSESPCEHVFSFDRVTRTGYALRESQQVRRDNEATI